MINMVDVFANYWAKSPCVENQPGESITAHVRQVLINLQERRKRNPKISNSIDFESIWNIAAWACILHDLGKVVSGFQDMLRGGPPFLHRHELISLIPVSWFPFSNDVKNLIAASISTHHKDLNEIFTLYPFDPDDSRRDLLQQITPKDEDLINSWLSGAGIPDIDQMGFAPLPSCVRIPKEDSFAEIMHSLAQISINIKTLDVTQKQSLSFGFLRGLLMLADHAGSAHLNFSRILFHNNPNAFRKILYKIIGGTPWHHQELASRSLGDTILIAPTGSGKTEAALLWALKQISFQRRMSSVFYTLPHRASLNAMRARFAIKYSIPDYAITLQHASATSALYNYFMKEKKYTPANAIRAVRFERQLGHLMTAPVRIMTPYQLLKAFFGLPGHESILTDAAGGLFIFDELHAYDFNRLALILTSIQHLSRNLGATFFFMSATFPQVLQDIISSILGKSPHTIKADQCINQQFTRHICHIINEDLENDKLINLIVERFQNSEVILVVATTVSRARKIFNKLQKYIDNDKLELLHSRFTNKDRVAKESFILNLVTTGRRTKSTNGFILVATQVVEVSLDVDFDVLFSDPAPIESLIQRFGRVNRGLRGGYRDVIICSQIPDEGDYIYPRENVQRSLQILTPFNERVIKEDYIQEWVNSLYQPIADRWSELISQKIDEIFSNVIEKNYPLSSHPELKGLFDKLFDGFEVIPEKIFPEYDRLKKRNPIEASSLFIPISFNQADMLRRKGLLEGLRVKLEYNPIFGLDLTFPDNNA